MSDKIIKAEEGIQDILEKCDLYGDHNMAHKLISQDKIEFTKLHVTSALKAAAKKAQINHFTTSGSPEVMEKSILQAYDLNLIQ